MDSSRRPVESYWRARLIDAATSDEDKVTPVYKLEEIAELLRSSHVSIAKEISEFVLKRLDHKSPIVKQKALRLIKYVVGKSGVEFRREMQRHSVAIRQLSHYKGQLNPLKGDSLNKAVRDAANETVAVIFSTDDNKPAPSGDLNRRIESFGNKSRSHLSLPSKSSINSSAAYLAWLALFLSAVKLLLIPAYRSTDFEVHRHWLALTHSLPLSLWYSDETSPWTLDYPPFFAHFEHFLSLFPPLFDPTIVHLTNGLHYSSQSLIIFHRITVIISDLALIYAIYRLTNNLGKKQQSLIWVLVLFSPGLLIVDHMHFQYNGFLLGILLLSLSWLEEGRDLMGGFGFAVLLCFKHLFSVAAPVYFVYLLRHYCRGGFMKGFGRLVAMGTVVVAVFVAAYGPFAYYGQIQQVLHRMFPFGRGLCHAYWAPNFWVFYIILDKLLAFLLAKMGFYIQTPTASFTGGLVGDSSPFSVLPKVTPLVTFVLVLLSLLPCLVKIWRDPQPRMITRWVAYAYTCGFLFGWHVHEKASLHFVIPLAIVAIHSVEDAKHYFLVSVVSCYSLFPLLYEAQEYPIKVLLLLLYSTLMWFMFSSQFNVAISAKTKLSGPKGGFSIGRLGESYLLGLLAVETWGMVLHPIFFGDRLPFLPLMMISIYCALGMMYSWIWQLNHIIRAN